MLNFGKKILRRLLRGGSLSHEEARIDGASTRFVIFGQGRTGSSLLRSLLNSHPKVRCEGEILAGEVPDAVGYVEALADGSSKPVFGFKVKIYQLSDAQQSDPTQFLNELRSRSYRIIYLRRNNLLRHALSNEFAEARSSYHDRSDGPRPTLTVNPEKLIGVMRRRRAHLEREAAVLDDFDHLTVEYESDLLDPGRHQQTADRIFTYVGLESAPVDTDLSRSVSGSLSDRIANYEELASALEGTEFSHFLNDPAYG